MNTDFILTAVKKPIEIQAIVWEGTLESFLNIHEFMHGNKFSEDGKIPDFWESNGIDAIFNGGMSITTLEGTMTASIGDFVIKGVNGEFYPCKPDIFQKTYDIKNWKAMGIK